MLVGVGMPSSFAVTRPRALYATGIGLTTPQSMASSMPPFPDRVAASLLGLWQMTLAALLEIGLGPALGHAPSCCRLRSPGWELPPSRSSRPQSDAGPLVLALKPEGGLSGLWT
jgi:hypothetical protein